MAKFTLGKDVYYCICGELVVMARQCPVCGRNNADVLCEKAKAKDNKSSQSKTPKTTKKNKKPAWEDGYLQSFLFKKHEK